MKARQRRSIPRKLKETLLEQSNNQCSVCGAKSHLQLAHIRPLSLGGDNSPENLIVLCPTCHVSVDRSGLNPDILSSIKKAWTERHIQGRGEVLKVAEGGSFPSSIWIYLYSRPALPASDSWV